MMMKGREKETDKTFYAECIISFIFFYIKFIAI